MAYTSTSKINKKGHLEIGGCDTVGLVKKYGSPLFVVDERTLRQNCREYIKALKPYGKSKVIFANKAFCTAGVLKIIASEGLGMDVASGGELFTALKAGIKPKDIFFHGNFKKKDEIELAVKKGIGAVIADNYEELEALKVACKKLKKTVNVILRVNPGVEAHTHEFIKTGAVDSKFGFQKNDVLKAVSIISSSGSLKYFGLHAHIGSQIFEKESYVAEVEALISHFAAIKSSFGLDSGVLNIGGGIGIAYLDSEKRPSKEVFFKRICSAVRTLCKEHGLKLPVIMTEPGRSIVGDAVVTLYTVGTVKRIPKVRNYAVIDGGMSDNPRFIMYGSKYRALAANKAAEKASEVYTIAGRACESGDVVVKDIKLPIIEAGDIIAVDCTGAYNYSMASNYNRLCRPAAVSVKKGKAKLILKRETYDDLVRCDL